MPESPNHDHICSDLISFFENSIHGHTLNQQRSHIEAIGF